MRSKFRIRSLIAGCLLLGIISYDADAQISISNVSNIAKIKNGTTYITMKDPESETAKAFIDVYKKYWTLSKVEFIKYDDVKKYVSEGSSFFSFGGFVTTGNNGTSVHIYLELWNFSEKFLNSNHRKKITSADRVETAKIELFTDFSTMADPDDIFKFEYDGDGHFRNWSPGLLKNYIQQLNILLDAGKKRSIFAATFDNAQLSELKKQTLYVPDYVLVKFNAMTGSETNKSDEKDLLKGYEYEYKLLPMSELSDLILNNPDPIYYMVYVKSSTDKYITVFNSATGEMIYSVYKGVSYNIGAKDFKAICGKIK